MCCYCKSNFPASVGLFGDNKSAKFFAIEITLQLTCFVKDKQTLKTEETLYKLDLSRNRPICVLFLIESLYGRLFDDSGSNYLQNNFTAFAVGLSGQKLNSKKSRKFFIIAVDFNAVLRKRDEKHSSTRRHEKNLSLRTGVKILFIAAQRDLGQARALCYDRRHHVKVAPI